MTDKMNRRQALTSIAALAATSTLFSNSANANAANAFYRTGEYTYCDLKILAAYWKRDTYQAKIAAGQKILSGYNNTLKQALKSARPVAQQAGVRCTFADADNPSYSYNDAVKLARHWGVKTPWDAKLKIASNLFYGGNLWVRGQLAAAR